MDAESKANLLLNTFTGKFSLIPEELNQYSDVDPPVERTSNFLPVRVRHAMQVLKNLKEDSGTGPDLLSAKVLKNCCSSLALPVAMLARLILKHGIWPAMWKIHWILPLYKKKAVFDPMNYRGVHLPTTLQSYGAALRSLLAPFF